MNDDNDMPLHEQVYRPHGATGHRVLGQAVTHAAARGGADLPRRGSPLPGA